MISIVTGSIRKREEIKNFIQDRIEYKFLAHDLDEIQGTAEEIVKKKAFCAHKIVKGPVIVEDYSLYIDKLCGFPGPYVKSMLSNGELGQVIRNIAPLGEICCTAECLYGYIDRKNSFHLFSTKARGVLLNTEIETKGLFGVDHLLVQEGTNKPYQYLTEEEKSLHSIRRKTIDKVVSFIQKEKENST